MTEIRWRNRIMSVASLALVALLVAVSGAQALTLGDTTAPAGASLDACAPVPTMDAELIQSGTDSSYSYVVPAGGGAIDSWSFNTTGATPGTPYGLVVVRPSGAGYAIVGSDLETIPTPAPPVATFALAAPIQVQAGDLIGDLLAPTSHADCDIQNASGTTPLPASDVLDIADSAVLTPGTTVNQLATEMDDLANVSADLLQSEDVGVSQLVLPATIPVGGVGAFVLTLTASGAVNGPITLTDAVPAGLSILSATDGSSTCTVSAQTVSCPAASAPSSVVIVVSSATAGAYTNTALLAGTLSDPNEANNTSSATLDVTAPALGAPASSASSSTAVNPAPVCHVVSLAKVQLAEAERLIGALGCKAGKVSRRSSKSIPKGDLISTSPGAGKTLALNTKIAIVVSSGKPAPKHKKK
jgi:hypothetical protein